MGNYQIAFSGVLGAGVQPYVSGITDLAIHWGQDGPILLSTTRAGGGLATFNATTGTLLQTVALSPDLAQLTAPELFEVQGSAQTHLAILGLRDPALQTVTVLPSGSLVTSSRLEAPGQDLGLLTGLVTAPAGSNIFHYGSIRGTGLLRLEQTGETTFAAPHLALSGFGARHVVSDILSVTLGGQTYIVTSFATADALSVFRVNASGALQRTSDYGAAQGLGIDAPTALTAANIGQTQYIIAASTLSGSLSVFELGAGGILIPVDHVIDDLNTRFQRVTALESITVGDRVFVIAGGGDDGVSLFLLLPGGRLVHLDSFADTTTSTLANVAALTGVHIGQNLRIFVASEREHGITQLSVNTANKGETLIANDGGSILTGGGLDDILMGKDGNDTLFGGAGHDILYDGHGSDRMTGGPGADLFVLAADGQPDVITDFQPGLDRLDLSAWVGLTDPSQLAIITRNWGAEIRFRNEVLELRSESGSALSRSEVLWAPVLNLTRLPTGSLPAAPADVPDPTMPPGTALTGGAGNETLTGSYGPDTIFGGAGDDLLIGDAGNDWLSGAVGNDTLFGGDGDDTLIGWLGADVMDGGEGSDLYMVDALDLINDSGLTGYDRAQIYQASGVALNLSGWSGVEQVNGYRGNDTIDASALTDPVYLFGERGDDVLIGGTGDDTIFGGPGNDVLFGGDGHDWLSGMDGDDTLFGGDGDDTLIGWLGADVMDGGEGSDLYMVDALDLINDSGRTGYDRAQIYQASGVALNLSGWSGIERVNGYRGNDTIDASALTDPVYLFGERGDDVLIGGAGHDTLLGGPGDDSLDGGTGNDFLVGGAGADHFIFRPNFGRDVIADFEQGTDLIDFSALAEASRFVDLSITQFNDDAIIRIGSGGTDLLVVAGIDALLLTADDFIF
jgi:Ca2+-binding RTX toxin-like protein